VNDYRYDVVKKKLRSKPICDIDHVLHMCTDRILDGVAASVMLLLFRVDRSSSCSVPRSLFQEFPVVSTIPVSDQTQLRVKAKQRAVPDKGEAWEVESEEEEAGEEKSEARHRSRTSASDKEKSTMKSYGNKRKRKRPKDCDYDSKGTIKMTR
jgi:hypothetical protein